jgi:hypothetical protein
MTGVSGESGTSGVSEVLDFAPRDILLVMFGKVNSALSRSQQCIIESRQCIMKVNSASTPVNSARPFSFAA